jgi:DNA-binding transcriptional ArsR family regulator
MNAAHLVRATDPLSSVLAAERVPEFAPNQYERILAAMKTVATSHSGATPAEIGEQAGLTMVQVDRRMKELRDSGLVYVVQRDGGDLMRNRMRCWALGRGSQ